jgi:hypothetical protein
MDNEAIHTIRADELAAGDVTYYRYPDTGWTVTSVERHYTPGGTRPWIVYQDGTGVHRVPPSYEVEILI